MIDEVDDTFALAQCNSGDRRAALAGIAYTTSLCPLRLCGSISL